MNALADEDSSEYIPTVEVIRIVRVNFPRQRIHELAIRNGYTRTRPELLAFGQEFDDCVAVEIACRELLNANRWLLPQ